MLKDKHILLGISGGIAAYKTPELIRLFVKAGAQVRVVATKNALEFVTELTLQTVSKNEVYTDTFAKQNEYSTEHIALNDWADVLLVAPATANILGKFASGIGDDALSTSFLAFNKPVFAAPAMNTKMFNNAAVQNNMDLLKKRGIQFIEPTEGVLACGDYGKGRMADPESIFNRIYQHVQKSQSLLGQKILITAGPTYEKIDPVRFIGNFSTGKMGFALAEACASRGAEVILVSGPVSQKTIHPNIHRMDVVGADEMYRATVESFANVNAAILCAAVADFTPETVFDSKKKRGEDDLIVRLKPTKDIAEALGKSKKKGQILVGFALETDNELVHATSKLKRKNLDFIVLNSLNTPGAGFMHDTNQITIIQQNGETETYPLKSKTEVAYDIINALEKLL
jgi:phosphopantothenoylcysteine decarboxylase / phosphopantothenate---cysteine ligase